MSKKDTDLMDKIVSLCKRRGFVYPSSEIYGGFSGFWDYGPYGADLAYNLKDLWWKRFVKSREDMYGISSSIVMPEQVWQASGHLKNFTDPLVECKKCHHRFRADHLKNKEKCSDCGGELGEEISFNTMFPVQTGSVDGGTTTAYLRGELAQGMFVNFKNILDTFHPNIPFGIAQIGRAFRNEISPRDFIYRVSEFEIAEFEYFIKESDWEKHFEYWRKEMLEWLDEIGIDRKNVKENDLTEKERAHYSKRTIDFEYQGPIGDMEIQAIAYRTDYELGGEKRVYLKLNKNIAPVRAAVFPLLKNKPELVKKARELFLNLKSQIPNLEWDDNGNIGKRYRRQDEIGTPFCITVDFDTLEYDTVTIRDRDNGEQRRISITDLKEAII